MARAKSEGNGHIDRLEEATAALEQAQANLVQVQANTLQKQTTLEQAQVNLVQAQANLVQASAALVQQHTAFLARTAETDRINSERFRRIEAILLEHSHILAEHTRILEALPEAVRRKFGFAPPGTEE